MPAVYNQRGLPAQGGRCRACHPRKLGNSQALSRFQLSLLTPYVTPHTHPTGACTVLSGLMGPDQPMEVARQALLSLRRMVSCPAVLLSGCPAALASKVHARHAWTAFGVDPDSHALCHLHA